MLATGRREVIVKFGRGYVRMWLDSHGEIQLAIAKVRLRLSALGGMLRLRLKLSDRRIKVYFDRPLLQRFQYLAIVRRCYGPPAIAVQPCDAYGGRRDHNIERGGCSKERGSSSNTPLVMITLFCTSRMYNRESH